MDAPSGGTNIVSGIGLYTDGISSRATALLWKAGANSLVDDVRFLDSAGFVASGALSKPTLFAERGGEAAIQDRAGTVYIADGQVYGYAPDGRAFGQIDIPGRPIHLLFGSPDRRTLFIFTRKALSAIASEIGD